MSNEEIIKNPPKIITKALFVGINYVGTASALQGCIDDVVSKFKRVQMFGPRTNANTIFLVDDLRALNQLDPSISKKFGVASPTKVNIEKALDWLVTGNKAGDFCYFHNSGHGTYETDTNGDEDDGRDECLCPVDCDTVGMIKDDFITKQLHKIPAGCLCLVEIDSCHSGTIGDLCEQAKLETSGPSKPTKPVASYAQAQQGQGYGPIYAQAQQGPSYLQPSSHFQAYQGQSYGQSYTLPSFGQNYSPYSTQPSASPFYTQPYPSQSYGSSYGQSPFSYGQASSSYRFNQGYFVPYAYARGISSKDAYYDAFSSRQRAVPRFHPTARTPQDSPKYIFYHSRRSVLRENAVDSGYFYSTSLSTLVDTVALADVHPFDRKEWMQRRNLPILYNKETGTFVCGQQATEDIRLIFCRTVTNAALLADAKRNMVHDEMKKRALEAQFYNYSHFDHASQTNPHSSSEAVNDSPRFVRAGPTATIKVFDKYPKTQGVVIIYSGCLDSGTSADATIGGYAKGAMTHFLMDSSSDSRTITNLQVMSKMREGLKRDRYEQVPQLSFGTSGSDILSSPYPLHISRGNFTS